VKEKNCIITGGTSGLGLALVKKFINNNFFIHIIAKDNNKIQKLTNYFHGRNIKSFKFYQADLAEKNELNKVILQIKNLDRIDVLINNAGALFYYLIFLRQKSLLLVYQIHRTFLAGLAMKSSLSS